MNKLIDLLYGIYQRIVAFFDIIFFIIVIIVNLILCIFLPIGVIFWLLCQLFKFLSRNYKKNVAIIFAITNIYILFRCLKVGAIYPEIFERIFSLEMLKWEVVFFIMSYITGFTIGVTSYSLIKGSGNIYIWIFDRKTIIVENFHCLLNAFSTLIHG